MNQYRATFSSTYEEADKNAICITSHLKKFYEKRITNTIEFNLNFVMREMFNNAVEHGNKLQSEKEVVCRVLYNEDVMIIEVTDEGQGFTQNKKFIKDPARDKNCLPVRNRGLWLIEQLGYILSFRKKTIIATFDWRVKKDNEESE